jgi:hypothetical protein
VKNVHPDPDPDDLQDTKLAKPEWKREVIRTKAPASSQQTHLSLYSGEWALRAVVLCTVMDPWSDTLRLKSACRLGKTLLGLDNRAECGVPAGRSQVGMWGRVFT